MSRPRRRALVDAAANVVACTALGVGLPLVLYPAIGLTVSVAQALAVSLGFSGLALLRGYALRRLFARLGRARAGHAGPAHTEQQHTRRGQP